MTIQQLHDWALDNGVLNYDIETTDHGYPVTEERRLTINSENKTVLV